jgi:hypothetical protein
MERKPIRTRLQNRVIKGAAIAPSSITADEVEFGTNLVSTETPEDFIINPKDGQEVTNPDTGGKKVYDEESGEWVDVKDPAAQASADGKNTIYRQDSQPSGGTYVTGDVWFDTDDDNKIYRYNSATSTWVGFTLGNNALASISANKITAGTIDASVITVSNLDAGNITTGTITGRTITGATITGSTFQLTQINSYGTFTIASNLYGSPSLTWGPLATPSFEIYQAAGGDLTSINADGVDGNGYLAINAGVRIELQAPEVFFYYTPKAPSGTSSTNIGSNKAYRNIYATSTAGTPTGGQDGDIVVVHAA